MRGPEDFPPTPWFELLATDASKVGKRADTIAYERHADASFEQLLRGPAPTDANAARCAWLLAHGGRATRLACATPHEQTVRWSNAAGLRRVAQWHRRLIERDFAAMVRELRQQRLLLADDAKAAQPNIELCVHDDRGRSRAPLPEPAMLLER